MISALSQCLGYDNRTNVDGSNDSVDLDKKGGKKPPLLHNDRFNVLMIACIPLIHGYSVKNSFPPILCIRN